MIAWAVRNAVPPPHIHLEAAASPFLYGGMLGSRVFYEVSMSTAEYSRKLDELDRLLNDPDVPMQPDRVWSLLAEVSCSEASSMHGSSINRSADR